MAREEEAIVEALPGIWQLENGSSSENALTKQEPWSTGCGSCPGTDMVCPHWFGWMILKGKGTLLYCNSGLWHLCIKRCDSSSRFPFKFQMGAYMFGDKNEYFLCIVKWLTLCVYVCVHTHASL